MKRYETPIEGLYERALLAMDRRTRAYQSCGHCGKW
nr:MAG TPA: Rubredoxin metal binding domain [Bacteriophage sp.]